MLEWASTAPQANPPSALYGARVHSGVRRQTDSPHNNYEINARWHLVVEPGGVRTADLLNAILKTSNSLSFLNFPRLSEIPL